MTEKVKMPMNIIEIQKILPHRFPFLLLDRVLDYEPNKFITAIKCISITDPILQGHFPDNPVVPGVIIVEGVAQVAAVLGGLSSKEGFNTCLLTEITSTRFRRSVVPGDVLTYDVKVVKTRKQFFWFEATVRVEDEVAATVELSAILK